MSKVQPFTEAYVNLNGIDRYLLHYRSNPEVPVILVFRGGLGNSTVLFAYFIEEYVGRHCNVVYYDYDQRALARPYLV